MGMQSVIHTNASHHTTRHFLGGVCVGYLGKKRKIVLYCGRRMPTSPRVAA